MRHLTPVSVDLSAAARAVIQTHVDRDLGKTGGACYYAAMDVWEALTGLQSDAALSYAREVAATNQRAAVCPF